MPSSALRLTPLVLANRPLLHVGVTQQLQSVNMGWEGLTVTVTSPDGTTQTLGPFRTDSTGGMGAQYTPASVGNYTLQTHFPEQVTTAEKRAGSTAVGAIMLASDSDKLTLIVTQEPRQVYPGVPLPTEYWTRPINQQFREWYPVAKSFLGSIPLDGIYAEGHDEAPESGHILWTKPLTIGGLVGGEFGELGSGGTSVGFETGDAYQGKFSSPGIIAGILVYTHSTSRSPAGVHCCKRTYRRSAMDQNLPRQPFNIASSTVLLGIIQLSRRLRIPVGNLHRHL